MDDDGGGGDDDDDGDIIDLRDMPGINSFSDIRGMSPGTTATTLCCGSATITQLRIEDFMVAANHLSATISVF